MDKKISEAWENLNEARDGAMEELERLEKVKREFAEKNTPEYREKRRLEMLNKVKEENARLQARIDELRKR